MQVPVVPVAPSLQLSIPAEALAEIQHDFAAYCRALALGHIDQLPPLDRRFAAQDWITNPFSRQVAYNYTISAEILRRFAAALEGQPQLKRRIEFALMQWLEAASPTNFPALNPEVQRRFIETSGETGRLGFTQLLDDLQKGRIAQSDEDQFEVGGNLATTAGSVIFQNRVMQLIQYTPVTPQVHAIPLVMVPPCINKYYVLDLQAHNSLVAHLVQQGFTVFMISWRNPLVSDADGTHQLTWDDYVQDGILQALAVASQITQQPKVNAFGFCVGGTLLATALAAARQQGIDPVASLTLVTSFLDFSDTGIISVFIDEEHVRLRERQMGQGGLMPGRDLATTFSFLRPAELVWNYVVSKYLRGETPRPFDFLFWNADSTNLPGPFFTWYLRNTYLENNLVRPGAVTVAGTAIDLGKLDMPAYIYASKDDHIVPWSSAYASTRILTGPRRFVLGASGHIAGVINPPAARKRHYWVNDIDPLPIAAHDWFENATRRAGSWWPDWFDWLREHSGERIPAPDHVGDSNHPPLEDAPGAYVRVRAA